MYKIKHGDNILRYCTLFDAFKKYKDLRALIWWEIDQSQLKIFSDDGQDITEIINDYLDGRNRKNERHYR